MDLRRSTTFRRWRASQMSHTSDDSPGKKPMEDPVMPPATRQRRAKRLAGLAKNFDRAVETLPHGRGDELKREQREIANKRRRAQVNDTLLRHRIH